MNKTAFYKNFDIIWRNMKKQLRLKNQEGAEEN